MVVQSAGAPPLAIHLCRPSVVSISSPCGSVCLSLNSKFYFYVCKITTMVYQILTQVQVLSKKMKTLYFSFARLLIPNVLLAAFSLLFLLWLLLQSYNADMTNVDMAYKKMLAAEAGDLRHDVRIKKTKWSVMFCALELKT